MNRTQKLELAGWVLHVGKNISPDRFPRITEDVIDVWAEVLGSINVPTDVWPEAVKLWATEVTSQRMCTPADLKRAAKTVIGRWESDPQRGPQLKAHRQALQDERDRQLKDGTFAQIRGRQPRPIEAKPQTPQTMLEAAREAVGLKPLAAVKPKHAQNSA